MSVMHILGKLIVTIISLTFFTIEYGYNVDCDDDDDHDDHTQYEILTSSGDLLDSFVP